jgi:photosystem II stability/assembly factor-like uncharacterized protein
MFENRSFFLLGLLLSVALVTTGCISFQTGQGNQGPAGGVFRTTDKGLTWQQKGLIASIGNNQPTIAGLSAASMTLDPSDHTAIYFGSVGNGLFYSYDKGESWHKAQSLKNGTIRQVQVAPDDKCNIFATIGNEIYRSTDCSRTWERIYYDTQASVTLDALVIDHYDPANIYAGLSRGEVIKSSDSGDTWQTVFRQEKSSNNIMSLAINPNDSRHIYAVVKGKGIYRSLDAGADWSEMESLNDRLKELKLTQQIEHLSFVPDEADIMYVATGRGMVKSADGGKVWDQIELIPPEKQAAINDVAVNPHDSQEIYYVTRNAFFSSNNGGETWRTKKLPTPASGQLLLIDPEEPNILYMGVQVPKK